MVRKLIHKIVFYRKIHLLRYIYLNFFCKSVVRTDRSLLIPYKGAVIDIEPGAKIILGGGDMEIGCDLLKGSREETRVRLRKHAIWSSEGGCRISYGATVEVLSSGILDTQFFTMNTSSILIAAKKIALGRDVMIGRNVVVYDSDHHAIRNLEGNVVNPDVPVSIGDHVWLASNVTVLKGTTIGSGSVVSANTIAYGDLPNNSLYKAGQIRENYGSWHRGHP